MKDLSKLLLAGLFTIGFSACSNDELDTGKGAGHEPDAVYMQFKLETPETRSGTTSEEGDDYVESDGTTTSEGLKEYGQDYENKVNSVLVVLTKNDQNNTYITSSYITTLLSADPLGKKDTYIVPFEYTPLAESLGDEINVYVYCNVSESFNPNTFNADEIRTLSNSDDASVWTNNSFLMSSAEPHLFTMPDANEIKLHKVESNPFDMGMVHVERSAARFDYKAVKNGNEYTVQYSTDGTTPEVKIKLTHAALINMSKEFYYLRRTSADGTNTNWKLCGTETSNNYVVDTDWNDKQTYNNTTSQEALSNFYYPINNPSTWTYTDLTTLTKPDEDNEWNADKSRGEYHIWRYATENTIPQTTNGEDTQQKNGISTGIVFKGQILPEEGCKEELATILNNKNATEAIYIHGNILYGDWEMVEKAAGKTDDGKYAETLLGASCQLVNNTPKNERNEALKNAGFTRITPTGDDGNKGYKVIYYYWNRHNDNEKEAEMGPMEFAVVRNNVYKLSVTEIAKYGHPTLPGDPGDEKEEPDPDPDPIDPNDPDEDDNVYFRVAVKVLPWTVRINEIIL